MLPYKTATAMFLATFLLAAFTSPAWAQQGGGPPGGGPPTGGLQQCTADLGLCATNLGTCAVDLGVCATNLATAYTDLQQCQDDLAQCEAQPAGGLPGDGVTGTPLSYTDNGDDTFTDNVTGLTWEIKVPGSGCPRCVLDLYSWADATTTYIDAINTEALGDHTDWRLPNVKELQSLIDYSTNQPAVGPIPGETLGGWHWSSTIYSFVTGAGPHSFAVNFSFGNSSVLVQALPTTIAVRAVRGP